jgi:ubiquinone/menaquinone biosynthesis C-methylase UbiE
MEKVTKSRQEFFKEYLHYTSVAHSLWRCYECERFAKEELAGPVLDLGCGDGYFAKSVFGHLQAGVDLNSEEVANAQERGIYDQALVASATELPFKDRTFNTVISNCVMEHIPDIDSVLSEVYRVLKPGGRLLTTVPSEYWDGDSFYQRVFNGVGFNQAAQWYNRTLNKVSKHYHVDDSKVWKKRIEKAGLKLQKSEYMIPIRTFHSFERWFIPAIPSKIFKALFKRWLLWPRIWEPSFFSWWFKDLLKAEDKIGACYFLVAIKPKGKKG